MSDGSPPRDLSDVRQKGVNITNLSDVRRKCVPLALREVSKMFDKRVTIYPCLENSATSDGSVSVNLPRSEISEMFDGSVSIPLALREMSKMFDERVSTYPVQRTPRCLTKVCLSTEYSIQRSPRRSTKKCPSSPPRCLRCSTKLSPSSLASHLPVGHRNLGPTTT